MSTEAEGWLAELAATLPRHHAVLRALVDGVRDDPRAVQLSIACSLVRGTADEMSDLDCELSLEPEAWPEGLELVEPLVRSVGPVVYLIHHHWAGGGTDRSRRTAVIYEDGVQLDLMVWPADVWSGMRPPDTVVLHAKRPVFTRPWDPARALPDAARLHEWWFLGWWALLDADKYLRRGSAWEARQRIEEARNVAWQLAAAARRLPFSEHGITALLDAPRPQLPPGFEATATGLDPGAMRAALERCAELLEAQWEPALAAAAADAEAGSTRLAEWARQRLARPGV